MAAILEQKGLSEIHADELSGTLQIGRGSFGRVVSAKHYGSKVAVKYLESGTNEDFVREVRLLAKAQPSQFVVRFVGFVSSPVLGIVMEFLPLSLDELLFEKTRLEIEPHKQRRILSEIAHALEFLHSRGQGKTPVLHLDLKPANVMLTDEEWHVRVGDFGLSTYSATASAVDKPTPTAVHKLTGLGTRPYKAPEVWERREPTTKVDIYALGIVMWEVIVRERAYDDVDELWSAADDDFQQIWTKYVVHDHGRPQGGELGELKSLVSDCWHSDPTKRPTAKEVAGRLGTARDTSMRPVRHAPAIVVHPVVSPNRSDEPEQEQEQSDEPEQEQEQSDTSDVVGALARLIKAKFLALYHLYRGDDENEEGDDDNNNDDNEQGDDGDDDNNNDDEEEEGENDADNDNDEETEEEDDGDDDEEEEEEDDDVDNDDDNDEKEDDDSASSTPKKTNNSNKDLNESPKKELLNVLTAVQVDKLIERRNKESLTSWEDVRKATNGSHAAVKKLKAKGYYFKTDEK